MMRAWLIVVVLAGVGVALAQGGQAVPASSCGPGRVCQVGALEYGRPFARFDSCTAQRYGRTIVDLDAGVIRMCQRDAGWSEVGSSSASGDGYWYDAGAGYVATAARVTYDGNPSTTGKGFGYVSPSSGYGIVPGGNVTEIANVAGRAVAVASVYSSAASPSEQYGLFFANFSGNNGGGSPDWGAGLNIGSNSSGGGTSTHVMSGGTRIAEFHAGASGIGVGYATAGGLTLYTSAGSRAVTLTTGAYVDLGAGSSDAILSDGTNTATAGGLKIGNVGSRIASSTECTVTTDGGTIAANTCENLRNIACSPATTGAPCVVGVAGGTSNKATMITQCWVSDVNVIALNICNVGSSSTPPAQSYSMRVFNP